MCPKCNGQMLKDGLFDVCLQCGHEDYGAPLSLDIANRECRDPKSLKRAEIDQRYRAKRKREAIKGDR